MNGLPILNVRLLVCQITFIRKYMKLMTQNLVDESYEGPPEIAQLWACQCMGFLPTEITPDSLLVPWN